MAVTDNFNRADGDVGAHWTEAQGAADVSFNQCQRHAVSTVVQVYWAANSFNADQSSQGTVPNLQSYFGFSVRMRGTGGTTSGYYFYVDNTGFGECRRYDNGVDTSLFSFSDATGVTTFKLEITGNSLTLYFDGVSAHGTTDSTYASGGAPGFFFFDAGAGLPVFDDWVGTGEIANGLRFVLIPS